MTRHDSPTKTNTSLIFLPLCFKPTEREELKLLLLLCHSASNKVSPYGKETMDLGSLKVVFCFGPL